MTFKTNFNSGMSPPPVEPINRSLATTPPPAPLSPPPSSERIRSLSSASLPPPTPVKKRASSSIAPRNEWANKKARIGNDTLYLNGLIIPLLNPQSGDEHRVYSLSFTHPFQPLPQNSVPMGTSIIFKEPKPTLDDKERAKIQKADLIVAQFLENLSKKYPRISPKTYVRPDQSIDNEDPNNSGFWMVENIPHPIDRDILKTAKCIEDLPDVYQEMLGFIRYIFGLLDQGEPTIIDLRPANLRIRDDGSFAVIDALPPLRDQNDLEERIDALVTMLSEWANGNRIIHDFLTKELSPKILNRIAFNPKADLL